MRAGLSQRWRLAALLHDAPEYVVGDLISPFKAAVGLDYKALENKLLAANPHAFRRAGEAAGGDHGADQTGGSSGGAL